MSVIARTMISAKAISIRTDPMKTGRKNSPRGTGSVVPICPVPKLKAVTDARGGSNERIFVRGDSKVDYGTVMKIMGRLSSAGFSRVALVTEVEQGS